MLAFYLTMSSDAYLKVLVVARVADKPAGGTRQATSSECSVMGNTF